MKLHYGAVPEAPDFDPQADGWSGIREPGPLLLQILAIPVALVTLALLGGLFAFAFPPGSSSGASSSVPLSPWALVLILIFLVPVHEVIHALCTPQMGATDLTLIGIWPAKMLFYAYYDGPMSRSRFLITFLGPFVVLSLLPIAVIALGRWYSLPNEVAFHLMLLSFLNGAAASGDLIGFVLVLAQIPATAIVRNFGWRTFWKAYLSAGLEPAAE